MRYARLAPYLLLLGIAGQAGAQDIPPEGPPPPEPPVAFYGPTDVRTLADEVSESRIETGGARIVFEPATAVGEESSWLALGNSGFNLPVQDRPKHESRSGRAGTANRAVRMVVKDRSLILPNDGP